MAWGVEAEGDDEGDDESDEEKGLEGQVEEIVKNDFDAISRAEAVAMVEMEVEVFQKNDTNDNAKWPLINSHIVASLPCTEGQLSVPISLPNSQKVLKLSPVTIRYFGCDYQQNFYCTR